jgi:molybdenum cofactor cytidylyltransferase
VTTPSVSAVLLAAGESSRMGRPKALLPWQGVPLIDYQLDQLAAVEEIRQIVAVTGHARGAIVAAARRRPRVSVAHNPAYRTGKVSSVLAGLRALAPECDAVLLLAVDQPRPASILRTIVQAHLAAGATITVPVRSGRAGHPVVFSNALLPELLRISEESLGVRDVVRRHVASTLRVEIANPIIHLDLNVPADMEAAQRQALDEPADEPT